jgi:hypothetical protein
MAAVRTILGAISFDRAKVAHALSYSGSKTAYCGWKRFNYNKLVDLRPCSLDNGYEYIPPKDVYVTCLQCLRCILGSRG